MPQKRAWGGSCVGLNRTVPALMGKSPVSTRSSTDLPLPDVPVRTVACPANSVPLACCISRFFVHHYRESAP